MSQAANRSRMSYRMATVGMLVLCAYSMTPGAERTVRLHPVGGATWVNEGTTSVRCGDSPAAFCHAASESQAYSLLPLVIPTYPMPLEIMGVEPVTKSVSFNLDGHEGVDRLRLRLHRPAYGPLADQAKVSVRLNGGSWVDLLDSNPQVEVDADAQAYGGLGGGFHTVWVTITGLSFNPVMNTLRLRFNGLDTEGVSSGFRLLDLMPVAEDRAIAGTVFQVIDDPVRWEAPHTDPEIIDLGRSLWNEAALVEQPGGRRIRADCADCHAQDGTDLEYYSYSNNSIIVRSQHHGLSVAEGEAIASYIRSLNSGRYGRPWQPPYQPGPGTDARPAVQWAAGAGLAQVLDDDYDMLPYLFPEGTRRGALRSVIDASGVLNLREIPVAIQFPDWNEWLPRRHPSDMWPDFWFDGEAKREYDDLIEKLEVPGVERLLETGTLEGTLTKLEMGTRRFIAFGQTETIADSGSHWRTSAGTVIDSTRGISNELGRQQLAKWLAVRYWDIMHRYKLEDRAPDSASIPKPEIRSWPMRAQSVHAIAPHITSDTLDHFADQPSVVGDYFSTAWYQLQMTLSAGMSQPTEVRPVDWPYQLEHIEQLSTHTGRDQPFRWWATAIKMYQTRNNGAGANLEGWTLRNVHPWRLLYGAPNEDESIFAGVDEVLPDLHADMTTALLEQWLAVTWTIPLDGWPRRRPDEYAGNIDWFALEPVGYRPDGEPFSGSRLFANTRFNQADNFYRLIPLLRARGVNDAVLDELLDWCEAAWPGAEEQWRELRSGAAG